MLLKIEFLITKSLALRAAAALYSNVKSITCLRKVLGAANQIGFPTSLGFLRLFILLFSVCAQIK